jgi:hypothetical protein
VKFDANSAARFELVGRDRVALHVLAGRVLLARDTGVTAAGANSRLVLEAGQDDVDAVARLQRGEDDEQ